MHNLADARPFYVVHAMMAFVAADRPAAAMRLAEALASSHGRNASSLPPEDALAAPLCEALLAFARSDYASCVERLKRVRHIARRCGGSLAQCDVIHLTLTEAALRARQARVCPRVGGGAHRTQASEPALVDEVRAVGECAAIPGPMIWSHCAAWEGKAFDR